MNVRLEIDRKFLTSPASSASFFRIGITKALLCETGKEPSDIDLQHMFVMKGSTSRMNSRRMFVGIRFKEHDFAGVDKIILLTQGIF